MVSRMPKLDQIQLPLKDEARMALIELEKGDTESAESRFYNLFKYLSEINGNEK